jgi:hypothetical protein
MDLSLVSECLSRDIRLALTGRPVDVPGVMRDLSTFRKPEVRSVLIGLDTPVPIPVRGSDTKGDMLQRVRNVLTAYSRSEERNYC